MFMIVSVLSSAHVWFFFFSSRRRHTRYWRDWSSDVCSSDLAALAQLDLGTDEAERTDGDAGSEPRTVLDDRARVDAGFAHSVTSMAETSASHTRVPRTFASPLYHHMLRRLLSLAMWY